ncbi:unnamed protein product [Paramecium pentaurelia]|uniref:Ubiquitin-like domain-containing protein n=1 Tax=Paramecium pentaurelia TaxID=43138 RepID=A0A8S1V5J5_9CILI|nr:unnamed protein product [Paramecium pentaurelia]
MNSIIQLIVNPQKIQLKLEIDQTLTVEEILQFIQQNYIITTNIDEWTCYSDLRQRYLNNNERIVIQQNEKLYINTEPQSELVDLSEQSDQSSIYLFITNGNSRQELQAYFHQDSSLEEIAQFVLKYCQLTENVNPPFVSIKIYNQAYNDVIKRSKSLSQLSIKNNSIIDAIISQQTNKSR